MKQQIEIVMFDGNWYLGAVKVYGVPHHGNITTGNPGSGSPNRTHYRVEIAGREFAGVWDGDARHDITVEIGQDDPLFPAVEKISAAQKLLKDVRAMRGDPPIGYRRDEWTDLVRQASADYQRAKGAMEADPVASELVAA